MNLYEINNCNASLMSDYIYQEANTASRAILKRFNVKTKRSGDRQVDFLVTKVEAANGGGYYKRGNQLGLVIIR